MNSPWLSSFQNDFNYDYHVTLDPEKGSTVYNYKTFDYRGELPGLSVFFRDDNDLIFHSYSTYFRGLDMLLPMYHCHAPTSEFLDDLLHLFVKVKRSSAVRNHNGMAFSFRPESRSPSTGFPIQRWRNL
jgi:hypothetical protein